MSRLVLNFLPGDDIASLSDLKYTISGPRVGGNIQCWHRRDDKNSDRKFNAVRFQQCKRNVLHADCFPATSKWCRY